MTKPKRASKLAKGSQSQESGSITFSTRFTEEQRDRIVAAAEIRGWTPSNLMRVATLEKSAHILNTSKQTRFDFKGLAIKVANQLIRPEGWLIQEPMGDRIRFEDYARQDEFDYSLSSLSPAEVSHLKQAARLGGAELLNMIIEICESLTAPDSKDLPDPIEPA